MAVQGDDAPNAARALREAIHAESAPSFYDDVNAGGSADEGDDGADEGSERDEGSSPEPASSPSDDDDEGTSPEPEERKADAPKADDDEDEDDWSDEELKTREQYGSERKLVQALRETKTHSLRQYEELKALRAKLSDVEKTRTQPPVEGTSPDAPADGSRPSAPTLPDTPEVRSAVGRMDVLADEYDEIEKTLTAKDTEIKATETSILQKRGLIEHLESRLKAGNNLDEYVRSQFEDEIRAAKGDLRDAESTIARLRLEHTQLRSDRREKVQEYHGIKGRLLATSQQVRMSEEARQREQEEFTEQEQTERTSITKALDRTISELKIPKAAMKDFRRQLLIAANGHPGRIADLEAFFGEQGKFILRTSQALSADEAVRYGEDKRRDAAMPAPRGPAAAAKVETDRPLSSRDAFKRALAHSRRVPI